MSKLEAVLGYNKSWAQKMCEKDIKYFTSMAVGQSPEYLWIGCSDSRVEANRLTGLKQGELFVHHNIANIFDPEDNNTCAVLQYAVETLKVKKIIVCGHYCCGGVRAALVGGAPLHVDTWINPIREVIQDNKAELDSIIDETLKWERLVELNTCAQVKKVKAFPAVKNATHDLSVHACVYSIRDGVLKELT